MNEEKKDAALERFGERVRLAEEAFQEDADGEMVLQVVGVVVVVAKDEATAQKGSGISEHLSDALWATLEHAEQAATAADLSRDDFLITLE
jgi:hypothetical protein